MSKQTDYSTQLLEIAEDFVSGTRLTGIDPQNIPDSLRDKVEVITKSTPTYFSLNTIETIVVAVLFHKTCTDTRPWVLDLLNSIFSHQTPLSQTLRIVQSLCDRDITYSRKYQGRPAATAFFNFGAGAISDLFFDTVDLSERAAAWIVDDSLMRGFFGEAAYRSNTEFLNDWSQAINHVFGSDFDWYADHPFWNFHIGSIGAQRELDRISRRLAITTIKIPFVDMIAEFELSLPEQLVIMFDLRHDYPGHSWSPLNVNFFCEPHDSLWFATRPPLTEASRLVRIGLFVHRESTDDSTSYEYHLSERARRRIIARADENNKCPLV